MQLLSIRSLPFEFTTGGRHEAGYKGYTGDCVVRAICVATGRPYKEVYKFIHAFMKANPFGKQWYDKKYCSPRYGVNHPQALMIMAHYGFEFIKVKDLVPSSGNEVGDVTQILPAECIIQVKGHCVAYKRGVLHDTGSPSLLRRTVIEGVFVKKA